MPRKVRNYWVEIDVDGRESPIGTGPRNKEGGIGVRIYMRNKGTVEKILDISGTANGNNLRLSVNDVEKFLSEYHRVR